MSQIYRNSDSFDVQLMKSAMHKKASTLTRETMTTTFNALSAMAIKSRWKDHNGKAITPETLTKNHLTKFVKAQLDDGISIRTLQNRMSHIRRSLKGVGRDDFADRACSNSELRMSKSTRIGTGRVVDPAVYANAIATAPDATRAWASGMYHLNLRVRELTRCSESLQQWERQIIAGQHISIHDGTKNGRSRQALIPPADRPAALDAVRHLMRVAASQGGRVVDSKSLESACRMVSRKLGEVGLKGKNSPHSLRRACAMRNFLYYKSQGFSEKESLSRTSADLGHGSSRHRWVFNNYLKTSLQDLES